MPKADKPEILKIQNTMSPIGTMIYPWLQKADTRYPSDSGAGDYSVTLRVPKEDAECFMQDYFQLLEDQAEAVRETLPVPKQKKLIVRTMDTEGCAINTEFDDETGEETGNVLIKFKNKEFYIKDGEKVSCKPRVVDCNPKALGGPQAITKPIFSGSEGRISCGMKPYYHTGKVGVKLQFTAVQVTKLVSGGGSEGGNDFDDIDGYYEENLPEAPAHSDNSEGNSKESF